MIASNHGTTTTPMHFIRAMIAEEARRHGATYAEVIGPCRARRIVNARDAAIRRVYTERPNLSYPRMGRLFGGRHHSTILHSLEKTGGRAPRPMGCKSTPGSDQ